MQVYNRGFTHLIDGTVSHRVVGRTRWGLIYRSGRPVHASSDDVSHLLNRMNIRTIIDLRTPDEQVKDGASQLLSHFTPDPISDEKTLTKTQIIRGVSLFASAIIGLWIYIVTSSLFKSLAGIMVFFSAVIVYLVLLGFNKRRNSFMPKDNRNPKKRELERGHLANSNYDDSQPSCSEALTLSIAEIPSTFGLSSSSRSCLCGRSPSSPTSSITSDSTACQQNRNSSPRKTEAPSQTQNGGIAKSILGRFTQQKGAYELVDRQQMIPISIDEDEEEIELGLNSDIDPDIDIEINMNLGLSPREDLRDGLGASLFSSADPPRSSKGRHPTEKMPLIKTTQCMESSDQGRKLVPGSMPRRYVRISLANNSFIRKGVLGLAPYHVQIPVLAWLLIGRKDMAAYVLTKGCVSQWNLTEFYTRLIEYSQPQILKIVFHCTHGKDRTGVIAALLLGCIGVSVDDIAQDYSVSGDHPLPEGDSGNRTPPGMTKAHFEEVFLSADPETMHNTLAFVIARYGSVENYMDRIGFGAEKRTRLRELMVESTS